MKRFYAVFAVMAVALAICCISCKSSKPAGEPVPPPEPEQEAVQPAVQDDGKPPTVGSLGDELKKAEDAARRAAEEVEALERAQNIAGQPAADEPSAISEDELAIIRDLEHKKRNEALVKEKLALNYYELAKKYYGELRYTEAIELLEKAIQANPSLVEAKRLRQDIKLLMGEYVPGNEKEMLDNLVNQARVQIKQAIAEVGSHIEKGRQFYQIGEFDKAEKELNVAIEQASRFPEQIDLSSYKVEAEGLLKRTTEKRRQKDVEYKKQLEQKAREEELSKEQAVKREYVQMMDQLYRQAQLSFENGRYEETEMLCQQILDRNPNAWLAEELMRVTKEAKHFKNNKNILDNYRIRWKDFMSKLDMDSVLQNEIVRFTDREEWDEIRRRKPIEFGKADKQFSDRDAEINSLLDTIRIPVSFSEANTLRVIVDFLRRNANVNILFDERKLAEAGKDPDSIEIPGFDLNSSLRDILKFILEFSDLDYRIKNGAVIITVKEDVSGETVNLIFDISDLVGSLSEFPAPEITLSTGEETEPMEPKPMIIQSEEVVNLIRENIAVGTWETNPGSITPLQGKLMINHTPAVQEQVKKFINGIRQSTGILVNVDSKFLTVRENFLSDIGIDWRGLNAAVGSTNQNPGPEPIQPDGTNAPPLDAWAIPALTQQPYFNYDAAGNAPSAGVWWTGQSANSAMDLRARVENILVNDSLVSTFFNNVFNSTGGASLIWTLIDDTRVELVMRAVRKDEDSRVIMAPSLTLFNGQRGHVIAGEQIVYLKDYTIEIAAGAATPDPQMGVFQNGTALDVRPIVSSDKKYVTVEVRPTSVTPLIDIRNSGQNTQIIYADPPAPGSIATVRIELPLLQIQKVRTTVTVPDQGTVILGGMSELTDLSWESEIPLVNNLPIIGNIVSRKMEGKRKKSVLILIKATIIIMEEQEEMRFGTTK